MPKILAIDDKRDNLISLSALLKALIPDCQVITAQSGAEGLKMAADELPDTILLDIRMPGMDGYEVCKRLKKEPATKHIPVIMISAISTESDDLVKGLDVGADAYLAKPIDEHVLTAQVKTALQIKESEDQLRRQKDLLETTMQEKTRDLQASEIKYRVLADDSPDIRYQTDMEGNIIYISRSVNRIFGYRVEEVMGRKITDLYKTPEDRDVLLAALQKDGYINDFVAQLQRKDGSLCWFSSNAQFYKDDDGTILGVDGIVRDVNQHIQAELLLQNREAKLKSIMQAASAGIGVVVNRVFQEVNQRFCDMVGYSEPELLEKNARLVYPSDEEYARASRKLMAFIHKPSIIIDEISLRHKNGSLINTLVSWSLFNEDNMAAGIVFNALDISEQKRTWNKFVASEKRFRTMMEAMSDPVYIHSDDYRVKYMNPAMIKRTGRDASGEKCFKALHDFGEPCPWCVEKDESQGKYFESDIVSPIDNHSYHISHSPMVSKDGSVSNMVIFRDTTEIKKLEAQLSQSQKMESIGNLAGGIAHDFNNILTIINIHSEVVQMELEEGSELWLDVDEIRKAGERAANLTRQLLAFSRKQMIMPKSVNINKVIADLGKMLGRLISEDISLETSLDEAVGMIYADPGQLDQIIINLVINARDAIKKEPDSTKKTIRISTSQVFLDDEYVAFHQGSSSGWHLQLQVEDNGCGMSDEVRNHIFEPFYTTKGVGEGTGMGLATVYGIVKQNQGNIYTYSEPGLGTTFKLYWPIMKVAGTEVVVELPERGSGGNEVILLAEDNAQVRKIISRQLRGAGYTIIEAENGLDALKKANAYQGEIDLLFTDVIMPLIGGKKLSAKIIKIYPDIVILFASGYSDDIIHKDILNKGEFINKPYNIPDIMSRIRRLLEN